MGWPSSKTTSPGPSPLQVAQAEMVAGSSQRVHSCCVRFQKLGAKFSVAFIATAIVCITLLSSVLRVAAL